MTFEKTVTVTTEKLETVDALGRKQIQKIAHSEQVDYHDNGNHIRRAA